jgi:hypothetical protein
MRPGRDIRPAASPQVTVGGVSEAMTDFTGHHAFLLAQMLGRVDAITADIAALDARIEEQITPFAAAVRKLDEVPGISAAAVTTSASSKRSATRSSSNAPPDRPRQSHRLRCAPPVLPRAR